MWPGEYRNLQWAFTKTGTYELSVHLNGSVRKRKPENHPVGENWYPISEKNLVSADVERYTFQVGPLVLNPQPLFLAEGSVDENTLNNPPASSPQPIATVKVASGRHTTSWTSPPLGSSVTATSPWREPLMPIQARQGPG